jgi:hypothetical protein
VREDWETQLLAAEDHPLRQPALQNDLALIGHFDTGLPVRSLQRQAKAVVAHDLRPVPGSRFVPYFYALLHVVFHCAKNTIGYLAAANRNQAGA